MPKMYTAIATVGIYTPNGVEEPSINELRAALEKLVSVDAHDLMLVSPLGESRVVHVDINWASLEALQWQKPVPPPCANLSDEMIDEMIDAASRRGRIVEEFPDMPYRIDEDYFPPGD